MRPAVILLLCCLTLCSCSSDKSTSSPTPNPPATTVTDIDGNVYATVTIGTQVWMAENLKVTRYRNGDSIPNVTDSCAWGNLGTGAYCNFANDTTIVRVYGRLYNWYAASDARNIAPTGWHVATSNDWIKLVNYLGGKDVAGGKLKEAGNAHWSDPNIGATNESGFSALPGAGRTGTPCSGWWGHTGGLGETTLFWFADAQGFSDGMASWLQYDNGEACKLCAQPKVYGASIRCVRD